MEKEKLREHVELVLRDALHDDSFNAKTDFYYFLANCVFKGTEWKEEQFEQFEKDFDKEINEMVYRLAKSYELKW